MAHLIGFELTNINCLCFFLSFPPLCLCVYVCCCTLPLFLICVCLFVCVCEGEVRSLRGDDMHVSRLLTSLRIIRLVGCPPPSHDGHSGNSPLSLHWCWCWLSCLWCVSVGWLFVCVFSGGGLCVVQVRNGTGHADVTCHTHTQTHTLTYRRTSFAIVYVSFLKCCVLK